MGGWLRGKSGGASTRRSVTMSSSFCNTQLTCPFFSLNCGQDWKTGRTDRTIRTGRVGRTGGLAGLVGLAGLGGWQHW